MKDNSHKKIYYLGIFAVFDSPTMTDRRFAKRQAARKVRREGKKQERGARRKTDEAT